VKIWESVLSIHSVGVKENFFDLGGHSLLVAKLLRRIERAFGKKLSMAAIFEAPTIEQQTAMLSNNSAVSRSSVVIPIQPAGSRPPFFFFGFNAGPLFLPLARRLGPDQPLLCVDPTPLEASQLLSPYKMEDIASCLIKEIRQVQPEGPYYLGGICLGGLVAYETASQLVSLGEEVALLALIEPQAPPDSHGRSNGPWFDWLSQRLRFHLGNLQQIGFKEARPYIRGRARTFFHSLRERGRGTFYNVQSRMNDSRPQNFVDVARLAALAYPARPFHGRVTLFQAANRSAKDDRHRRRWEELAATLEVHEIPGYSSWVVRFFLEPHVEILAHKLSGCLGRCRKPEGRA
jgi:thioesterase domain-containing protein